MRIRIALPVILTAFLLATPLYAQDDTEAVLDASDAWLALVDEADFDASWEQSSTMMQQAVTVEQWRQAMENAHAQLAALAGGPVDLTQREVVEVTTVENQPNLPEGDYRSVRYRTQQGDMAFGEAVTLQREGDEWKVIGYFVAPDNGQ